MNRRLSLVLAVALALGPAALLAQESSHPSDCTCPCHNQHPQSGAQSQDQGSSTTGNGPQSPQGPGSSATGNGPQQPQAPGSSTTGNGPQQPQAPGSRTTGNDPQQPPQAPGSRTTGNGPQQPQAPGSRTTGNGPQQPQAPGSRTTGNEPQAPQQPGSRTTGNGPGAGAPGPGSRTTGNTPSAGVPGSSLPGHPGACPCCSQKPQTGQTQSSDPVIPPEPWVWVEWWDAQFVAAKEATIEENSTVVKDAGAPWTLDWWTTSGTRAAMVFVYWPDTKDHRGYESGMVNTNLWFDEDVACLSRAFDCYRVDAKKADKAALAYFKVKKVPTVLILDPDRKVIARLDKFGNGRAMTEFLEETLKSKFSARYHEFLDGLKQLAKTFDEGKAAVQRQDFDDARDKLSFVVGHEFRTEDYPRAKELLAKSEKKLKK